MTGALNPLHASGRIADAYRRYLASTFAPRDPAIRAAFEAQLEGEFQLTRGPYLQAAAPYAPGCTLRDLVSEGVLHPLFLRYEGSRALPLDRSLHAHQETAIRKAVGGRRNLVVATGTGSGKTETFLIPILDGLLREIDAGTVRQTGVRALLLYPMNALANDQLRRLRGLLEAFPEITFGRYVGDTASDPKKALENFRKRFPREPRRPNELLSRQEMQATPPHLLLTNYAMLEYLLLRPQDSTLFDGETGRHWRAIALDEAHVYDGAQGAEIGMLLRRVRDRVVHSEPGRIQAFATSATLGRGEQDYPALLEYASALFAERFEWVEGDASRQDIVSATRRSLTRGDATHQLPPTAYHAIVTARQRASGVGDLLAALASAGISAPAEPDDSIAGVIAQVLASDERVREVQGLLESGSVEFGEVARLAFGAGHEEDLVALVDAAVAARHGEDDAPVLPARYHFLLRSLEGAFMCLSSGHPEGTTRFLLRRHERCPACASRGRVSTMFELGTCRRCGAEYLVGQVRGERLLQAPPFASLTFLLLSKAAAADDEDEADAADDESTTEAPASRHLCPSCGRFTAEPGSPCSCGSEEPRIATVIAKTAGPGDPLHRCSACAGRTNGEIVGRFMAGVDAPVSVLASGIYQELSPSEAPEARLQTGEGRKLLVFADSRQDAAFFAPYLERTHLRATERALILGEASRLHLKEGPQRFDDLVVPIVRKAEDALVLDPDRGSGPNRTAVKAALLRDIIAVDRRQSLEGTGMLEIRLVFPRQFQAPRALLDLGLEPAEVLDLVRMLIDTIRAGAAVTTPEGVDIRDEAFAPRNRVYGVRESGAATGVIGWLPTRGSNRRVDILEKVMARTGIAGDSREILAGMWRHLSDPTGEWRQVLPSFSDRRDGVLVQLSHERLEFVPASADHLPGRCDTCRQLWWTHVRGVCQTYGCPGTVRGVATLEELAGNHYASLYRALSPMGMTVEEHTAQWTQSAGGEIQDRFMRGEVNVLSCSTTFELGVDVGDVESVLLRNMPPSPANYVQRAGRAGRRLGAAALVVTYAQPRNHDMSFFAEPRRMIDGVIYPPRIRVDNATIVRRHVHAIAFAAFERHAGGHDNVGQYFEAADDGTPADEAFIAWLRERPDVVATAVRRVVPEAVRDVVGVDSWDWVDALVDEGWEDPTRGWLRRAGAEARGDLDELNHAIEAAAAERNYGRAGALENQRRTLRSASLLSYLARKNVLPKYGFPVDVISLDLGRTGDADAARLQLDRDLALAISEYAPGSQVVAAKSLWTSEGLRVQPNRDWPRRHWAICKKCGAVRQGLTAAPAECQVCGSPEVDGRLSGEFAIPVFGFAGSKSSARPGDARPSRGFSSDIYFSEYQDQVDDLEEVPALCNGGNLTSTRSSRQGRITVINRGPGGRGYQVCTRCGFGRPAPAPSPTAGRVRTGHHDLRRPGRKDCEGYLANLFLGHEYLTDVLEIRTSKRMEEPEARSTLYALLEGAGAVGVKRDELGGTLHTYGLDVSGAFIIFDAVPGGAGHALRVAKGIEQVAAAALARVESCSCGEETSCYQCLRSYSNQKWHDVLSRGSAAAVLRSLLGRGG